MNPPPSRRPGEPAIPQVGNTQSEITQSGPKKRRLRPRSGMATVEIAAVPNETASNFLACDISYTQEEQEQDVVWGDANMLNALQRPVAGGSSTHKTPGASSRLVVTPKDGSNSKIKQQRRHLSELSSSKKKAARTVSSTVAKRPTSRLNRLMSTLDNAATSDPLDLDGLDSLNSYLETSSPAVFDTPTSMNTEPNSASKSTTSYETVIREDDLATTTAPAMHACKDAIPTTKQLDGGNVATIDSCAAHGAENEPPQGGASSAGNVLTQDRREECKASSVVSTPGVTKAGEAASTDGSTVGAVATASISGTDAAIAAAAPAATGAHVTFPKFNAIAPNILTTPVCNTIPEVAAPLTSLAPVLPTLPTVYTAVTGSTSDSKPTSLPLASPQPPLLPSSAKSEVSALAESAAHSSDSSVVPAGAPTTDAPLEGSEEAFTVNASSSSSTTSTDPSSRVSPFDAFDAMFDDDAGLAQLDAVLAQHETKESNGSASTGITAANLAAAGATLANLSAQNDDVDVNDVPAATNVAAAVGVSTAAAAGAAAPSTAVVEQNLCIPGGDQTHVSVNAPTRMPPEASAAAEKTNSTSAPTPRTASAATSALPAAPIPFPPPAATTKTTTAVVQPPSAFDAGDIDIDDDCDFDFEALDRLEREAIEKDHQKQLQQEQQKQSQLQQQVSQPPLEPSPPLPMPQVLAPPLPLPIAPSIPSANISTAADSRIAAAMAASVGSVTAVVEAVVETKEDKSAKRQSFGCGFDLDDADLAELDALMEQQQERDENPAAPFVSVHKTATEVSKSPPQVAMPTTTEATGRAPAPDSSSSVSPEASLHRSSSTKSGDYVHHNSTEAFLADFDRRQLADHSKHLHSSSSLSTSVGSSNATPQPQQSLAPQAPPLPPHALQQEVQIQQRQQSWVAGSSDCPSTVHRFVVLGTFVALSEVSENQTTVSGEAVPVAQKRPRPVSSWRECAVWAQPVAWPLKNEPNQAKQASATCGGVGHTTTGAGSGDDGDCSNLRASTSSSSSTSPPVVLCFRESWRDCPPEAGDVLHVIGGLFATPHDPRRDPPPPLPPLLAAAPAAPPSLRTKGARKLHHQVQNQPTTSNNANNNLAMATTTFNSALAPKNCAHSDGIAKGSGASPSLAPRSGGSGPHANVWLVDDRHALVLNPDILLPPTRISTNTTCARRFVLQHRGATGLSLPSEATVMGNLKHALLEAMLQAEAGTLRDGAVRRAMVAEVVAQTTVDRCSVDLSDMKATAALMQAAPLLLDWVLKAFPHLHGGGGGAGHNHHHHNAGAGSSRAWGQDHASGSALLSLQSVVACEQDIWAPEWGLKGKVDATVVARPHQSALQRWAQPPPLPPSATNKTAAASVSFTGNPSDRVYPLELKTVMTKPNVYKQMEHRAQVMLYNLMMASRYGQAASGEGLLLYVEQGASGRSTSSQAVRSQMPELRSLLASRNRAARGLAAQRTSLSWPATAVAPSTLSSSSSSSSSSLGHPLMSPGTAESSTRDRESKGSNSNYYGNGSSNNSGNNSSISSPSPASSAQRNRLQLAFEQSPRITPLPPVLSAIAEAENAAACAGATAGSPLTRPRLLDDAAPTTTSSEGNNSLICSNSKVGGDEADDDGEIPEGCKFCFEKPACSLYHATHERGNGRSSGMSVKAFNQLTSHLTPADAAYFRVWDRAVDAEDAVTSESGGYQELWTESAASREQRTRLCLSNLELDSFHPILDHKSNFTPSPTLPTAAAAKSATPEEKLSPKDSHANSSAFGAAAMSSPFSAGAGAEHVQLVRFRRRLQLQQPDDSNGGGGGTTLQFPMDQSTKLEVGDRLVLSGERMEGHEDKTSCGGGGSGEEEKVAGRSNGDKNSALTKEKVVSGFGQHMLHHCVAGVIVSLDGDTVILGSDGTLPAALQHLSGQPYSRAKAANSQGKGNGGTGGEIDGEAAAAAAAAALVESLRSVVFRLDKFETTAGTSTARRSLVHLFTADARLADLANKEERAANKAAFEKGGSSNSANGSNGGGVVASSLERKLLTDQAPKMRSLIVNLRPPTFSMDASTFSKLRALHSNILPPQPSSVVAGSSTSATAADYQAAEQSWLALQLPGYGPSSSGNSKAGSSSSNKAGSGDIRGQSQQHSSQQRSSQQQRNSQQRSSQRDYLSSDGSGSAGGKFVAPPGCSPAALRQEWACMNVDQRMAVVKAVAANDYALILGMPGTGKTSTVAFCLRCMLALGRSVLVTAYTHSAVDNLLLKLHAHGVPFLRLGPKPQVHASLHFATVSERDDDPSWAVTPSAAVAAAADGGTSSANVTHPNKRGLAAKTGAATAAAASSSSSSSSASKDAAKALKAQVSSAKLIGATCLAAAGSKLLRAHKRFDCCVVDEAGQVNQPNVLGALFLATTFVLVGDDQQLPPLVRSAEARALGMDVSLFERLARAFSDRLAVAELRMQYRMNREIMSLCNALVYDGSLRCGSRAVAIARLTLPDFPRALNALPLAAATRGGDDGVAAAAAGAGSGGGKTTGGGGSDKARWLERALSPNTPVLFLDTDQLIPGRRFLEQRQGGSNNNNNNNGQDDNNCANSTSSSSSHNGGSGPVVNQVEAALVADLAAWLLRCGLPPEELGVCSPYRAQLATIKQELRRSLRHVVISCPVPPSGGGVSALTSHNGSGGDWRNLLARIEVKTVDKFQGRDKACLLVSTVHSNAAGEVGTLLDDQRRVNVLLSRAKHKLLLVGSASTLAAAKNGGATAAAAAAATAAVFESPGLGGIDAALESPTPVPPPRPSISADFIKLLQSKGYIEQLAPGSHEVLL